MPLETLENGKSFLEQRTKINAAIDEVNSITDGTISGGIPVTATGTTTPRTLGDRAADVVNVKDFGAVNGGDNSSAISSASSSRPKAVVEIPLIEEESALPTNYPNTVFSYLGESSLINIHTASSVGVAKTKLQTQFPVNHPDQQYSLQHLRGQSQGSDKNGPTSADYGQTISIYKKGFAGPSDPLSGEIDGLSVFVRQDGPKGLPSGDTGSADATGILVNIQNVEDCGFTSAWEASTSNYDRGLGSITESIQTQIGVIDANQTGKPTYGYVAVSKSGVNTNAFYAGEEGSATWDNILLAPNKFKIKGNGDVLTPTLDYPDGAWKIARGAGANGSTQITHRGLGALFLYAQDQGAIQFGTNGAIRMQITAEGVLQPINNNEGQIGSATRKFKEVHTNRLVLSDDVSLLSGNGSPEGVVGAVVGSMYTRKDGGAGTTLYVKESGTGNTGWVAK